MDLKLNNKNALVCGSTQGIGKATAMALAAEGVTVTLLARNEEKLKAVLAELPQQRNHSYIVADFSNPNDVAKVMKNNGDFHILINNTGGPKSGQLHAATPKDFTDAFNMHVVCNQILVQACLPFMKSENYGRIINVISTSVKEPIPGLGVSNTIRNAVANWAKTLSSELAAFGVTVNNVLPGFTDTARLDQIIKVKAEREGTTEAEMETIMKTYVPAKRFAKPEETANAITFLASQCASYINGINLPVDGGRTKSL
ncbi:MAG: SDR family oxidoreductase [Winogradskyella sp.]